MLSMLVENRIKEIFTVLNNDLIPHLFRLNGWDETQVPRLRYGKLREIPFESFAKAIQQTMAVKALPITAKNINYISEELGLPDRVDLSISDEDLAKKRGVDETNESGAGEGYATGSGNGTAKEPSSTDNSADNLYNK